MKMPLVHLAIDNCFASKRWTAPREWMELIKSLGVQKVEAGADTEADPLYMGSEYMQRWTREVIRCERSTGVKVVNLYSGHGTYTTLGLGHPDKRVRERMRDYWIRPMLQAGPERAYDAFSKARRSGWINDRNVSRILRLSNGFSYLFSSPRDSDTYEWIQSLGRYSPIIHLQQVADGRSAHLPFTGPNNEKGTIKGELVLQALLSSHRGTTRAHMPPVCSDIYLTLEIFSGTAESPHEIISKLQESIKYWRRFIPEDGMTLDRLL